MKNVYLWVMALFFGLTSCQTSGQGFKITGNFPDFPDSTKFKVQAWADKAILDSAIVLNGKVTLSGDLPEDGVPEYVMLQAELPRGTKTAYLILENKNLKITGNQDEFPIDLKYAGSPLQAEYSAFRNLTKDLEAAQGDVMKKYSVLSEAEKAKQGVDLLAQSDSLVRMGMDILKAYMFENTDTYPGIITLYNFQRVMPKDTLEMLYERISPEHRKFRIARLINGYIQEKKIEIGGKFIDFKGVGLKDSLRLSDIIGKNGKYTLLDFGFETCHFCREAAKEIHTLYATHSDSLQIISFSTDSNKGSWHRTVTEDNITWYTMWLGEKPETPILRQYNTQGYPAFFLFDPNGILLDRWVGFQEGSLIKRLEHLKNN